MRKYYTLRFLVACLIIAHYSVVAYSQEQTVEQQVSAITQEITERKFFKAGMMVSALKTEARRKFGSMLEPAQQGSAMAAATDQAATLMVLEQGRRSYQAGDWQGALYSFTAAQFGVTRLDLAVSPAERFARDKGEASSHSTPVWFHQAARTALEAGNLSESIDFAKREITMIESAYPKPASYVFAQRAYTLMGLAYLAQNDVEAANGALDASVRDIPAGAFGPAGRPSMALARQLLLKGQSKAVVSFLDTCIQTGWSGADEAVAWEQVIRAGNVPEFRKISLLY